MKSNSSLNDWLYYIEGLHENVIDLGLSRVQEIAVELDILHPATTVILVGGTNGKGTTCSLLEVILLNNNISVGVYSSPHLVSYTERLRINGKKLEELDHVKGMSIIEEVRSSQSLTYFEFITLSNLYLLKHRNLDVVILEVGLGGRLDATNIVFPDISVVTNVAIDHTDLLGCDYMDIAKEKFGIFRFGKPAIIGDFSYPKILRKMIYEQYGAIPFIKNEDWWFYSKADTWSWCSRSCRLDFLPFPKIPVENAAVVLSVLCFLPFLVVRKSIDYSLNIVMLPGRFQIISCFPYIILDVAHNPHAAVYLLKKLKLMNILGVFRMVVGMLSNKNIFDTLHIFDELVPVWYFASLQCYLGVSSFQLSSYFGNHGDIQKFSNVYDAFDQAVFESNYEDCIVIFGSFHTVAPILGILINGIK